MEAHFGWPKKDDVFRELQRIRRKEGYHIIFQNPKGKGSIRKNFPQSTTGFYVSLLFYHATESPGMDVKYSKKSDVDNCYMNAEVRRGSSVQCTCSKSDTDKNSDIQGPVLLKKGDYSLMQFHMTGTEGRFIMDAEDFGGHTFDDRRLDYIRVNVSESAPLQEFHVTQDHEGFPSQYFLVNSATLPLPGTPAYVQVGSVMTVTGRPDSSGFAVNVRLSNQNFETTLNLGFPSRGTQFNITVRILANAVVLDASFVNGPKVVESSDSLKDTDLYFLNLEILNMIHECGIGND
ncbi:uncharacterized protein LOC135366418 isoform X1 [Ornithodoros turicata]|uniref:uncharacterized protein LOC135366418 isoform X1 n=1 Tax=Ornithodoros turicata TaxID=34597 RepID=UPI003139F030